MESDRVRWPYGLSRPRHWTQLEALIFLDTLFYFWLLFTTKLWLLKHGAPTSQILTFKSKINGFVPKCVSFSWKSMVLFKNPEVNFATCRILTKKYYFHVKKCFRQKITDIDFKIHFFEHFEGFSNIFKMFDFTRWLPHLYHLDKKK